MRTRRQQTQMHLDQALHHAQMAVVYAAVNWVTSEDELQSGSNDEGSVEDHYEDVVTAVNAYLRLIGASESS